MAARSKSSAGPSATCPWCSAVVPTEAAKCPSCGAALRDVVDDAIPGVTQIDLAATSPLARLRPGRLATWLGAERTTENPELAGHVEEPSEEVRREMLRLELAAIDAELEAQKAAAEANRKLPPEDAPEPTAG